MRGHVTQRNFSISPGNWVAFGDITILDVFGSLPYFTKFPSIGIRIVIEKRAFVSSYPMPDRFLFTTGNCVLLQFGGTKRG